MVAAVFSVLERIVSRFPQQFSYVFAYGSAVFPQSYDFVSKKNGMIDIIFAVDDPFSWHRANMQKNRKHYSLIKFAGPEFINDVQKHFGAKVYFNTLVEMEDRIVKYGVISNNHLIEDLLDWQTLYISGRLHKPVQVIRNPKSSELRRALHTNLQSALHASLLCLPETFHEEDLYLKIAGLSYRGDFRMYFGEDKRKIPNIVKNQIPYFQELYEDHIKAMPLLCWKQSKGIIEQDNSNESTLHHLNLLPKTVQHKLLVKWNKDGRYRDMEDVLQALAHDTECCNMVEQAVHDIVLWPSITQSAKGILTAGLVKSVKYSSRKIKKMFKSLYKKNV